MDVGQVSVEASAEEKPTEHDGPDLGVEAVEETVEITVANEGELFVVIQDRTNEQSTDAGESPATTAAVREQAAGLPPKKKRGRPSKKHNGDDGANGHSERRVRASGGEEVSDVTQSTLVNGGRAWESSQTSIM